MRFSYFIALGLIVAGTAALAEPTCVATPNKNVKGGGRIVLELIGVDLGPHDSVVFVPNREVGNIETRGKQTKATLVLDEGAEAGPLVVVCRLLDSTGGPPKEFLTTTIIVDSSGAASGAGLATPAPGPAVHGESQAPHPAPAIQNVPANGISLRELGFNPVGYMGEAIDGGVELDPASTDDACSGSVCIRLKYTPPDKVAEPQNKGWAAIAWQFTSGPINFGDYPGADLRDDRFRSLRFKARGPQTSRNKPPLIQFKTGGGTKPDLAESKRASYEVVEEFQAIPATWKDICIDVPGRVPNATLQNVVSALTVVFSRVSSPAGATIYLSDLRFSPQTCREKGSEP